MLTLETTRDLAARVGQTIGTSDWLTIDQKMIDAFATATGDDYWIHTDPVRAQKELPGGKTIAHGFLTLSLIPHLSHSIYKINKRGTSFNYGLNRVRFTSPVPAGSRVRLTQTLKQAHAEKGATRFIFECVIEREGGDRPVMVAESIVHVTDA
jgi:acyl dehydratase